MEILDRTAIDRETKRSIIAAGSPRAHEQNKESVQKAQEDKIFDSEAKLVSYVTSD